MNIFEWGGIILLTTLILEVYGLAPKDCGEMYHQQKPQDRLGERKTHFPSPGL